MGKPFVMTTKPSEIWSKDFHVGSRLPSATLMLIRTGWCMATETVQALAGIVRRRPGRH
jgi:hypothetical protein